MTTTRYALILKATVIVTLTAIVALLVPSAPARADGAASTRNIILGGALAAGTLLVINHNKKVHQKEDELSNARDQAEAQGDAAAVNASTLRSRLVAEDRELVSLKRQLAQQHAEIVSLRKQIGSAQTGSAFIAPAPKLAVRPPVRVASQSYGWGQL